MHLVCPIPAAWLQASEQVQSILPQANIRLVWIFTWTIPLLYMAHRMNRLSCDHSTLFETSELEKTHRTVSVFVSLTTNLLLSHAASIVPSGDQAQGPASFNLSLNCIFALIFTTAKNTSATQQMQV
jgi:hypothetical protein